MGRTGIYACGESVSRRNSSESAALFSLKQEASASIGEGTFTPISEVQDCVSFRFEKEVIADAFKSFLSNIFIDSSEIISQINVNTESLKIFDIWNNIFERVVPPKTGLRPKQSIATNDLIKNTLTQIDNSVSNFYLTSIFTHLDVIAIDVYYSSLGSNLTEIEQRFIEIANQVVEFSEISK